MAFRKRNVGISQTPDGATSTTSTTALHLAGTRPSPLDGRLTTSTGTPSLDSLLAGHNGLPLGHSLLIGESGTTDYAGALAKYFAAEGITQGHRVHVLGLPEAWGRELPGVVADAEGADSRKKSIPEADKMKIAWRYEGLGEHGRERRGASSPSVSCIYYAGAVDNAPELLDKIFRRRCPSKCSTLTVPAPQAVDRSPSPQSQDASLHQQPFCHTFDLTKRLVPPSGTKTSYIPVAQGPSTSPFEPCLQHLTKSLSTSSPDTIHRLVVPSLLSPALYPPHAAHPSHLLTFAHRLRSLLRQYSTQLIILLTLPLSLYPRTTGLIRSLEHLLDGVLSLIPFPHSSSSASDFSRSGASTKEEEKPQGLVKVHKLPVFHERGGGGGGRYGLGEDLAFTVSRRRFEIRPFSLPPAEGDAEAQEGRKGDVAGAAKDIEF